MRQALTPVTSVLVRELGPDRIAAMARLAANYYRDGQAGVAEELRFGDRVYFQDGDHGQPGAFLIVNLDYHSVALAGRTHHFTYLGLGCAKGAPMAPVFRAVKREFASRLEHGAVGVLHLTTRTPFAIRGLESAFGEAMQPVAGATPGEGAIAIATYLKTAIHKHADHEPGENVFVLRGLKQSRFRDEELARIRSFRGDTALSRQGIRCDGEDELIVFHSFVA